VQVLTHVEESPYIDGGKRPLKLEQLEARMDTLSEPMKILCENLRRGYQKATTPLDRTVRDGEVLPWCGGITVIHTPGHICLYLQQSKTVITGDVLVVEEGRLVPAPQFTNYDTELASRSLGG
jgi:glyoxylase-like metal-dependent hydrolase (beta-lactamase superfamily II)